MKGLKIKSQKKTQGELHDTGFGNDLVVALKAQVIRIEIDMLSYIKIKACAVRHTIDRVKRQLTE